MIVRQYQTHTKWTSIVEVIISIMLISLVMLGIFHFFNLQNKNIVFFVDDAHSENILDEAYVFLSNYPYADIPTGTYSLVYQKDSNQDIGSLSLRTISADVNVVSEGEYLNGKWENLSDYNLAMDTTLFKRTIFIENIISPIIAQKIKKITVRVWYPGCDFAGDPCKKKDFLITEPIPYE